MARLRRQTKEPESVMKLIQKPIIVTWIGSQNDIGAFLTEHRAVR